MVEPLLSTDRLIKRFGGLVATDSVSIDVKPGEIHALIGPNGAGKTTLVSQLTGNLAPDSGAIHFAGRDVTRLPTHARVRLGLARSFQITSVLREFTALDNVALAVQAHAGHSRSEERRVGKEWRSRWWPYDEKKKRLALLTGLRLPLKFRDRTLDNYGVYSQ